MWLKHNEIELNPTGTNLKILFNKLEDSATIPFCLQLILFLLINYFSKCGKP